MGTRCFCNSLRLYSLVCLIKANCVANELVSSALTAQNQLDFQGLETSLSTSEGLSTPRLEAFGTKLGLIRTSLWDLCVMWRREGGFG
eukprot:4133060-Amphidinium_carterae.1